MGQEFYGAYAAGTADPALCLLVETQAQLRDDVRHQLELADCAAGAFLESERPAPMSFRALERTLDLIDRLDPEDTSVRKVASIAQKSLDEMIRLPEPLKDHVFRAVEKTGWQFASPGLRKLDLDIPGGSDVRLLRIEPGHGAPRHTHIGQEYTLVVTGSFTDETGSFGPGDISVVGPDCVHRPIADAGDVCFALTVREGGMKFTGALGIIQKFFG